MIFFIKHQTFFFLFYKTSVFNRRSCCFSAITNAAMTVNDHWPAVILTADIHSSYLHIQKKKRKKCFLRSYHSVLLLIHSQVFDFNINIQFCYLFYIFSFFSFFSFLVLVKVHKLYKTIDQLYCYLEIPKTELHWVNGLLSLEVRFKLLDKLYPTYKTK